MRLYDCKTGKYYDFKTDEELKNHCLDNGISLCNWYHVAGNGFFEEEKTNLIGGYYLKTNLSDGEKVLQSFLKYFCQFELPLLVVLAGVIVFFVRKSHRNQIHKMFNPDDRRDSFNEKK